jgi:serine/threonine-protein kinase
VNGSVLGGHYVLAESLGDDVWRAFDRRTGADVAVRLIARSPGEEDVAFAERLHINARMASKLRDPRIVQVLDSGDDPALGLYLVTQFAAGQPLSAIPTPIGARRTMTIIAEAAQALTVAYDFGMFHGDLTPGSLFVGPGDRVALANLGRRSFLRRAGGAVLPPASHLPYLAPEVALNGHPLPQTDMYALGVIAFECITGTLPFTGETPLHIALAHVRDAPPPLPADVPACVTGFLARALAKSPTDRWESMADLAATARDCSTSNL